jgi:acetate kinase
MSQRSPASGQHILTLNAGSSSLKFAVFRASAEPIECLRGQIEGLGRAPRLVARSPGGQPVADRRLDAADVRTHGDAVGLVLGLIGQHLPHATIAAVGHRVVHGGIRFADPIVIDDEVVAALMALAPLAPLHQPHNLSGIAAARAAFPAALQVACFDTAFHRRQPWVNDTFALPRSYYADGVRRYGFHGLSYEYVTGELARIAPHHAAGRLVVAHLGNGASMCAINGGQSVASTMGFSALDGLPMGTRSGQLDPGVLLYLMGEKGMSAAEIEDLLYRRSGLLGLSGLSHDMRELEAAGTPEAQQAIDYFVFRVRRELGAMTAILSGLDAVVFCGGIGENAARIRERIARGFEWIGIELDETRNRQAETVISSDRSRVRVLVIRTNEEAMIARHVRAVGGTGPAQSKPVRRSPQKNQK